MRNASLSVAAILVSDKGGTIDAIRDGEVLASIAIPPGRVPVRDYLDLLPDGAHYEASEGLAVVEPRRLISSQSYGAVAVQSGANPDFQPTSASRFEKEMRAMVGKMQAENRGLAARVKAYQSIDRIPSKVGGLPSASDPLIEPAANAEKL